MLHVAEPQKLGHSPGYAFPVGQPVAHAALGSTQFTRKHFEAAALCVVRHFAWVAISEVWIFHDAFLVRDSKKARPGRARAHLT